MTEEEKKAKLKSLIEEYEICYKESKYEGNAEEYKSLKETHKLLKDILKELDKKDKVIDLMCIEYKENFNIDECKKCLENLLDGSVIDKKCTDCMKEYFYKQVEVEDDR